MTESRTAEILLKFRHARLEAFEIAVSLFSSVSALKRDLISLRVRKLRKAVEWRNDFAAGYVAG